MKRLAVSSRQSLRRRFNQLLQDRSGGMIVTYALTLPLLVGVVGMGLETGIWYNAKRVLQTQADAAALSGAMERGKGHPDYGTVSAAALHEAVRNGYVNAAPNTITINNPPVTGPNAGDQAAVEVILSQPQTPLFASLFLNNLKVGVRAVAAVETTGTACVLALDPTASGAIQNQGNPTILMSGCVLAANSASSSAITLSGSAVLDADSLFTAGNIVTGGSATMTLDRPPTVNAWPIDDPYEDITIPSLGSCDYNASDLSSPGIINPGVWCDGMPFGNGSYTLNPGTYYVNKGDIVINAQSVLRCSCPNPGDGVTFILTSTSGPGSIGTVKINGGANVILNAPTHDTDPYKGILFYQDRRAPPGPTVKFNGTSDMLLTGGIYIPNQTVEWSGGNDALGSTCTQIIGRQVKFVGNSTIVNTGCDEAGVAPLQVVGVRVVE